MFYEIDNFPFLKDIVKNADVLSEEFEKQSKTSLLHDFLFSPLPEVHSHLDYWVKEGGFHADQIGYDPRNGTWGAFPLFKKGFPIKWYDVEKTFPITNSKILNVPGVNFAAFFKIAAGSGAAEHKHLQKNLIFHLCLFDVGGHTIINCNGEEREISKKGDYVLFDYSYPHSSFNFHVSFCCGGTDLFHQ